MAGDRPLVGAARAIIFNADDFGLTAGVNSGIVEAYQCGLVRSASLMVTTPGFSDAVSLARQHPRLDLGIHLALTSLPPALPPQEIPELINRHGRFPPLRSLLPRLLAGGVPANAIRRELRAQVERALSTGLRFSHLDGHHHIHLFPPVAGVIAELAGEFGIDVIRRVGDVGRDEMRAPGAVTKRRFLHWADGRAAGSLRRLQAADAFRGVPFPRDLRSWQRLIAGLPPGVTEFMCHPGLADPAVAEFDPLVAGRAVELSWLCDPRLAQLFAAAAVDVITFAELRDRRQQGHEHEHEHEHRHERA
jgi:predicted glycoside hydrolase/deacetylase ChbG (UPF0249 family)